MTFNPSFLKFILLILVQKLSLTVSFNNLFDYNLSRGNRNRVLKSSFLIERSVSISNDPKFLSHCDDDDPEHNERGPSIAPNDIKKTKKSKTDISFDFVKRMKTEQQFEALVIDERDKIVVVRYIADWCKTCKAMTPTFHRLAASKHRDKGSSILFVEMMYSAENASLFERLGVVGVPYGQIYDPFLGLVHDMPLTKRSEVVEFEKKLDVILNERGYIPPKIWE